MTTTVKELIEAGCHFGASTQNWNPQMKRYIHGKRNKIHIIDLTHTVRGMTKASHFLEEVAATGRQVVFVCTKRQMRGLLKQEAVRVEMPWVTERWLGGTLTNFKTVRSRLERLDELEGMQATGEWDALPKKLASSLNRERRRITKNLDGLRDLNRIPGAMIVIDPSREEIAVSEARRVGVPIVSVLDTDCDPLPIDIPIPANDDSMRSVSLLLGKLTQAVERGVNRFKQSGAMPEDAVGVRKEGAVHAITDADRRAAEESGAAEPGAAEAPAAPGAPAAPAAPAAGTPAAAETPAAAPAKTPVDAPVTGGTPDPTPAQPSES